MGTEDQPDQAGEPKSGDDELAELERIVEEIERANAGRAPEEPMAKPAVLPDAPRQRVAPARTERPSGPAESYAWIRDWEQLEAGFCLLVTDRPDPVEVLGLVVPDPATPLMSSLEAPTWAKRMIDSGAAAMLTILEAKPVAAGTLVFEGWGGYTASVDGVPQRLSEHGHAAAVVQLTSNLDMSFKWSQAARSSAASIRSCTRPAASVPCSPRKRIWSSGRAPPKQSCRPLHSSNGSPAPKSPRT